MSKIARYSGNLSAFASNAALTDRYVFGQEVNSDSLNDNINADFYAGWGEVLGVDPKPPLEWSAAALFTATQLSAYTHQVGVPEYDNAQEYHIGSISNSGGQLYRSLTNDNVGNDLTDQTHWLRVTSDLSERPYSLFSEFGASGDGTTDCTPALNLFLQSTLTDTLYIPAGVYLFNSKPNDFTRTVNILGENPDTTLLRSTYTSAVVEQGVFELSGASGSSFSSFSLDPATGTTVGSLVSSISTVSEKSDNLTFTNVKLGTKNLGDCTHSLNTNGSLNAGPIRQLKVTDCEMKATLGEAIKLQKVVDVKLAGVFTSAAAGNIAIKTAGNVSTDNQNIIITSPRISGLELKQCNEISVTAPSAGNILTDATAEFVTVFGDATVTGAWVNSQVINGGLFNATPGSSGTITLGGQIIKWGEYQINHTGTDITLDPPFPNNNFGVFSAVQMDSTDLTQITETTAFRSLSNIRMAHFGSQQLKTVHIIVMGN